MAATRAPSFVTAAAREFCTRPVAQAAHRIHTVCVGCAAGSIGWPVYGSNIGFGSSGLPVKGSNFIEPAAGIVGGVAVISVAAASAMNAAAAGE